MILERTGDSRWCLKGTNVSVDTAAWLRLLEEASDECDEGFLPGA